MAQTRPALCLTLLLPALACTTTQAPARLQHPLLDSSGGPHSSPLYAHKAPQFNGDPGRRSDDASSEKLRQEAAQQARNRVGARRIRVGQRSFPFDCSGLVRASYMALGVDLYDVPPRPGENGVRTIYRYARRHGVVYRSGRPLPGDLVFFNNTYDRNHNGRRDDAMTHVGVVERVDDDGTVTVVHTVSQGVLRYRMNLRYPDRTRDPDDHKRINHYLRRAEGGQPAKTMAQLFAGYATVLRDASSVASVHKRVASHKLSSPHM